MRFSMNLLLILLLIPLAHSIEPKSKEDLITQKRKIEFNIAKLRVKFLTDDDELRKLNEQIIKQQKILMKKLDQQPEIKFLMNKLGKINDQLQQQSN